MLRGHRSMAALGVRDFWILEARDLSDTCVTSMEKTQSQ